jgi:hypothetical protein
LEGKPLFGLALSLVRYIDERGVGHEALDLRLDSGRLEPWQLDHVAERMKDVRSPAAIEWCHSRLTSSIKRDPGITPSSTSTSLRWLASTMTRWPPTCCLQTAAQVATTSTRSSSSSTTSRGTDRVLRQLQPDLSALGAAGRHVFQLIREALWAVVAYNREPAPETEARVHQGFRKIAKADRSGITGYWDPDPE